jgi:hypothetical protein
MVSARSLLVSLAALAATLGALVLIAAPALAKQYVPGTSPASFGEPGSGAGQLEGPQGVAVNDTTHDVYVVDTGNDRIDQFSSAGVFVRAWGWEVDGMPGFGECTLLVACQKGASGSGAGQFQSPNEVAVDNSGGASKEDVYVSDSSTNVVSRFSAEGAYLGQLTGTCEKPGEAAPCPGSKLVAFEELRGVAVDGAGDLWVLSGAEGVDELSPTGVFLRSFTSGGFPGGAAKTGLAVDSKGDVYVIFKSFVNFAYSVLKFDTATGKPVEEHGEPLPIGEGVTALAVNPGTDNLVAAEGATLALYGPFAEPYGKPVQTLPVEEAAGIGIDGATGTAYVSQSAANTVLVFDYGSLPVVTTQGTSFAGEGRDLLHGTVNPEGEALSQCKFEYVTGKSFEEHIDRNEVQWLEISGATGGQYTLTFKGYTTPPIAYGTPPYQVGGPLEALPSIGVGNLHEVEGGEPGHLRIEFRGALGHVSQPPIVIGTGALTPAGATAATVIETPGGGDGFGPAAPSVPCVPTASEILGEREVQAELPVQPGVPYHVRLSATDAAGSRHGEDGIAPAPPSITEVSAGVSSTGANVSAQIDPGGAPAGYRVQYVTDTQFNENGFTHAAEAPSPPAAEDEAGAGLGPFNAQVQLSGLQPGTAYHFRFLASNAAGTTPGREALFTTLASAGPSASTLPDGRTYELVSSPNNQNVFTPAGLAGGAGEADDATSKNAFQAAADGEAIAYVGEPPPNPAVEGGNGAINAGSPGNEYLATRGPHGDWAASDILPRGAGSALEYEAFTSDLTLGILHTYRGEEPDEEGLQIPTATPLAPEGCIGKLYSRTSGEGSYHALFSTTQTPRECGINTSGKNIAGVSADGSHLLFSAGTRLTSEADEVYEFHDEDGGLSQATRTNNLYDSVGGEAHLVNVLPSGEPEPHPEATFGGLSPTEAGLEAPDLSHVVSADGSRVFWSSLEGEVGDNNATARTVFSPKTVYVRENDAQSQSRVEGGRCTEPAKACTVQVSGAGSAQFWTATPDGRYAYYIEDGTAYRFDVQTGERLAVTAAGHAATGTGDLSAATGTGTSTAGSNILTNVSTSSGAFAVGQEIVGIGISTTITAIRGSELEISTGASSSRPILELAAGSRVVTSINTATGLFAVGQAIYGAGVPGGAHITGVSANTLTLSAFARRAGPVALTAGGSEAEAVIGASEHGSYLYFLADGALASGAAPRICRPIAIQMGETPFGSERFTELEKEKAEEEEGRIPPKTGCNLYVTHEGVTSFIATLLPGDDELGDWSVPLAHRTAEVSGDGEAVAFLSRARLTGYDNVVFNPHAEAEASPEVFVYDAANGKLACASCDPSGVPPVYGFVSGASYLSGANVPISNRLSYMPRWLSADGARVFFDTDQPLAPQDANGREDVYEWEREGSSSCPVATSRYGGCMFLLSGGSSPYDSWLVDASESGGDVFFTHDGSLVPSYRNEVIALYDAHECTSEAPCAQETPTACTGTGCQGVPPPPPIFATPASVTFTGTGNFPPPAPPAKKVTKKAAKCKRGFARDKKDRCVRRRAKQAKKAGRASYDRRAGR